MSLCECDSRRDVRLTSEHHEREGEARLRCSKCGGKVGYIPAERLCELVDEPEEGEPVTIELLFNDSPTQYFG